MLNCTSSTGLIAKSAELEPLPLKSFLPLVPEAIDRGIEAIQKDPEGSRSAMVKWAGLSPDLAGKIGLPIFEKGISEKDLQTTIDLTLKYKLIPKPLNARDVISDLAPKG